MSTSTSATPFNDDAILNLIPHSYTRNTMATDTSRRGRVVSRTFAEPASAAVSFVPESFSVGVFDAAEESIKYLVYTNTWKSFVADMDEDVAADVEAQVMAKGRGGARGAVSRVGMGKEKGTEAGVRVGAAGGAVGGAEYVDDDTKSVEAFAYH